MMNMYPGAYANNGLMYNRDYLKTLYPTILTWPTVDQAELADAICRRFAQTDWFCEHQADRPASLVATTKCLHDTKHKSNPECLVVAVGNTAYMALHALEPYREYYQESLSTVVSTLKACNGPLEQNIKLDPNQRTNLGIRALNALTYGPWRALSGCLAKLFCSEFYSHVAVAARWKAKQETWATDREHSEAKKLAAQVEEREWLQKIETWFAAGPSADPFWDEKLPAQERALHFYQKRVNRLL